jgi:hypothetical protein
MYISGSIALIAIGAILRYAVADMISGVSLPTVGLILMLAGAIGLIVSLIQTSMLRGRRGPVIDDR